MFIEKREVDLFYKKLKNGQTLRLVRDLSQGDLDKDMVQELVVKIYPENRDKVYELMNTYPVLVLEIEN